VTITHLEISNYKRIRVVNIDDVGASVVIAGRNGQGKSSILDAIAVLLLGGPAMPTDPVRHGAEYAQIMGDTSDGYRITRTITPDGKTKKLTIIGNDGMSSRAPQAWLDAKIAGLTFDPLAFTRMDARTQAATIRKLAGVDVSDLDAKKAATFSERTQIGRDRDAAQGALASLPHHANAPAEEVRIGDLLAKQSEATAAERLRADLAAKASAERVAADAKRARLAELIATIARTDEDAAAEVARIDAARDAEIARLTQAIEDAKLLAGIKRKSALDLATITKTDAETRAANNAKAIEAHATTAATLDAEAAAVVVPDVSAIVDQIGNAESTNAKVRANAAHVAAAVKAKALADEYAAKTKAIDALDAERTKRIADAKMPIEGLSFSEDGAVTFRGVPMSQASQAEAIRVSMAIGLAMSPELKIVLIRDGSLLDADSRALVNDIATAAGAQTWIEVVGKEAGAVEIEDGAIVEVSA
jgi:fibronectin type 3 domain-containing protein